MSTSSNGNGRLRQPCTPSGPVDGLSPRERRVILATQGGLPVLARPYHHVARSLALDVNEVMSLLRGMLARRAIRRIAAVPNHYALGYRANGMSVWNVADDAVAECGRAVGELHFVSHCYQRPRRPPRWPYNLFAMVHGRDREEVEAKVAHIAALLGSDSRAHDVLFSKRILKKTGLRLT